MCYAEICRCFLFLSFFLVLLLVRCFFLVLMFLLVFLWLLSSLASRCTPCCYQLVCPSQPQPPCWQPELRLQQSQIWRLDAARNPLGPVVTMGSMWLVFVFAIWLVSSMRWPYLPRNLIEYIYNNTSPKWTYFFVFQTAQELALALACWCPVQMKNTMVHDLASCGTELRRNFTIANTPSNPGPLNGGGTGYLHEY